MQAPQSPTAHEKRSSPSPFTAPLQAARRYLDRQTAAGQDAKPGLDPDADSQFTNRALSDIGLADPGLRDTEFRDIEFGDITREEAHSLQMNRLLGDADLAETRQAFSFKSSTVPNPEAVRAAIARLAIESQRKGNSAAPVPTPIAEPSRTPQSISEPTLVLPPVPSLQDAPLQPVFADTAAPQAAFRDVAIRVWDKTAERAHLAGPIEFPQALDAGDRSAPAIHPVSASAPKFETRSLGSETLSLRSEAESPQNETKCFTSETRSLAAEASRAQPNGLGLVSAANGSLTGPWLAHDASNLISALGLYSELLSYPGVLHPQHRHYADDLKLLAARSNLLIDRLLHLSQDSTGQLRAEAGNSQTAIMRPLGESDDGRDSGTAKFPLAAPPPAPSASESEPRPFEPQRCAAPSSSPLEVLTRWGSLLTTVARGALAVNFGPGAALSIPVAAEALERILVNLVRNAASAIEQHGTIRIGLGLLDVGSPAPAVRTSRDTALEPNRETSQETAEEHTQQLLQVRTPGREPRSTMVLTVDDSGSGMSEAQVARILTDEALKAAPSPQPRSGLGLQIVRDLVAASSGSLSIQSRPGTGTRIEIHWPTIQPVAAAADSPPPLFIEDELYAMRHQIARPGRSLVWTPRSRINSGRNDSQPSKRILEPERQTGTGRDGAPEVIAGHGAADADLGDAKGAIAC